jgi:hypothetical protein
LAKELIEILPDVQNKVALIFAGDVMDPKFDA